MNSASYNPLVSIALTTFNGGDLLRQQLDSILIQTYQNYEVVMSDDGSEEYTINILNEYCAKDRRFRWERSPLARGFRKNTENAIRLCKGEIIILCDQDDVWFPNKVQRHVEAYADPTVMWAFNRCILTNEAGDEIGYLEDTLPDYYRHKTMLENTWGSCIGAAQTSYRTSVLRRAMPVPEYCLAHDSWIQLAIYPAKPFFIDEITNTYRQHGRNMIGFSGEENPESFKAREKEAIEGNFRYLKQLSTNPTLTYRRRFFFLSVYIIKRIRTVLRKMVGQTDSREWPAKNK